MKEESKWGEQWEKISGQSERSAKRTRQTEHPEVSEMMYLWVSKAMDDGILLTGEVLRQKWQAFADLVGIPEDERLHLSSGWLTWFKDRTGLKGTKRHGEAGSASVETVQSERARIQALIRDGGFELRDVYNMDETGLFYGCVPGFTFIVSTAKSSDRMVPDQGLSDRKQSGVKSKKNRLTYAFTSNADGSDKLPPFIIGKAKKP